MAEYLDIVDENGIPTGETVGRETTHAKGFRHRPRLTQKHLRACLPANRQPQQKNKKAENLWKQRLTALCKARQKEFEAPTFRLGEPSQADFRPLYYAKKSL